MLYKCYELMEVLEQSLGTINRYIESLHNYIAALEKGIRLNNIHSENRALILRSQSVLSALLILRDINYKKLNMVRQKIQEIYAA